MRTIVLIFISLIFIVGGIMHFTNDAGLAAITPLPFALEIVWITGVMEFFFALFILWPKYRKVTGLWLSVFCLLILTANINMAINDIPMFGEQVDPLIAWLRIPMQFVLIAGIIYATNSLGMLKKYGAKALVKCE